MRIRPITVDRVSDADIVQALLMWMANASYEKQEQLHPVWPATGNIQHGIGAVLSEESNGREHVRLMPTDHADSTANH